MTQNSIEDAANRLLKEGLTLTDRGLFKEAIECLQEAGKLFRSIGHLFGQGLTIGLIGDALNSLGEFYAALECHQMHLAIAQQMNNQEGEIAALRGIGLSLDGLGDYTTAIECHKQSLELAVRASSVMDQAQALANIGIAYQALGDFTEAMNCYQRTLALAKEMEDTYSLTATYSSIGSLYFSAGKYELAIEHFQQCLKYAEQYGFQHFAEEASVALGSIYTAVGESDLAISIRMLQLASTQRRSRSTNPGSALIIGNPKMPSASKGLEYELSVLPFAEIEAMEIASLLKTQAITGDKATKTLFKQLAPQRAIIHLATHGLVEGFDGEDIPGALALSPLDGESGFLTTREIMNLRLNAELVVLSACNTGAGKITTDGVIGLSRSFILAGAPTVIASLWSVPDESTCHLMIEFYRNLETCLNKAEALRSAMLTTREKFANPLEWAGFILIGSPE